MNSFLDSFIIVNTVINSIWYICTIIFVLYKFTSFFTTVWGIIKFTGRLFNGVRYTYNTTISFFRKKWNSQDYLDVESQATQNYGTTNNNSSIYRFFNGYNNTNVKEIPLTPIYESKISDITRHGSASCDSQLLFTTDINNNLNKNVNKNLNKNVNKNLNKNVNKNLNKNVDTNEKLFQSIYPDGVVDYGNYYRETDSELLLQSNFINDKLNKNDNKKERIIDKNIKKKETDNFNLPFANI